MPRSYRSQLIESLRSEDWRDVDHLLSTKIDRETMTFRKQYEDSNSYMVADFDPGRKQLDIVVEREGTGKQKRKKGLYSFFTSGLRDELGYTMDLEYSPGQEQIRLTYNGDDAEKLQEMVDSVKKLDKAFNRLERQADFVDVYEEIRNIQVKPDITEVLREEFND